MCEEKWDSPLLVLMEKGLPVREAAVYADAVGQVYEERMGPLRAWGDHVNGLLREMEGAGCACTDVELCVACTAGVLSAWWERQGGVRG